MPGLEKEFPVVRKEHYDQSEPANVYAFIHKLSSSLAEGDITVVGNGSACVVGSHAYVIKRHQRFIINSAVASMGYDLPVAIEPGRLQRGMRSSVSAATGAYR